jgi:hypothetical protein
MPLHSNGCCFIVYFEVFRGLNTTFHPPEGYSSQIAYRRTVIFYFQRAVLVTSVIGLTLLPIARFVWYLLSTAPAAHSLRLLILSGSLIGCQSVQVYHHHHLPPVGVAKTT